MSKLRTIREANIRLEARMLMEQTKTAAEVVYSIQQNPQTKKFRIFVTTPKFKTPTDAESVFGASTNWKNYDSQADAQKIIDAIQKATQTQQKTPTPTPTTTKTNYQGSSDFGDTGSSGSGYTGGSDFGDIV